MPVNIKRGSACPVSTLMRQIVRRNPRDFETVRLTCNHLGNFYAHVMPTHVWASVKAGVELQAAGKLSIPLTDYSDLVDKHMSRPIPLLGATGKNGEEALRSLLALLDAGDVEG
jgi:hypothetical protein